MPLIPWKPFSDMDKWFNEDWEDWGEWLDRPKWVKAIQSFRGPKIDVYDEGKEIVVEAELPGLKPEDIDVEVMDNYLSVEVRSEKNEEQSKKDYYRREISKNYFRRVVPLPSPVLPDQANAEYKDGVLKLTIPKVNPTEKREKKGIKIPIK